VIKMAYGATGGAATALLERDLTDVDMDFTLDVRVIEAAVPIPDLLRSTSDNCGSTCSGTACTTFTSDPA
jgi:FxLD family lantipeptide